MRHFRYSLAFVYFLFLAVPGQAGDNLFKHGKKILVVGSEHSDVHYSGGLGPAVKETAQAYLDAGLEVEILMPGYTSIDNNQTLAGQISKDGQNFQVPLQRNQKGVLEKTAQFDLLQVSRPGQPKLLFLRHVPKGAEKNYFENSAPGKKSYGPAELEGEGFGAFDKASAQFIAGKDYDLVVAADWHVGLIPYFLDKAKKEGKKVPHVIGEIHNAGHQGNFPASYLDLLGMDPADFRAAGKEEMGKIEFYDQVSFLKTLLNYADGVRTVSLTHAGELTTPRFGAGMDDIFKRLFKEGKLSGVLNGIDAQWDPRSAHQGKIPFAFSTDSLEGKEKGKEALQRTYFGEKGIDPKIPVFVMTSRLAHQKGSDYLPEVLEKVAKNQKVQFLIIGSGEKEFEEKLDAIQKKNANLKWLPFTPEIERTAIAYGDYFINVPRYEPSGLNQLYALANGTIPIVGDVGGLKDSVTDGKTGIVVHVASDASNTETDVKKTKESTRQGLIRAVGEFSNPAKIKAQRTSGMQAGNSWASRIPELTAFMEYVVTDGPRKVAGHLSGVKPVSPKDLLLKAGGNASVCPLEEVNALAK